MAGKKIYSDSNGHGIGRLVLMSCLDMEFTKTLHNTIENEIQKNVACVKHKLKKHKKSYDFM